MFMPHLTSWHQQGHQHLLQAIYHMSQGCSLGSSSTNLQHKQGSSGSFWTDPHTHEPDLADPAEQIPYLQLSVLLLEFLVFIRVTLRKLVHFNAKFVDLFPDLCPCKTKPKGCKTEQYRNIGFILFVLPWFVIAYRWQKDLMFLLESASLLTSLLTAEHGCSCMCRYCVCMYIYIHTNTLYRHINTYISSSPPSSAHPCHYIRYNSAEKEHLTLSFSFRISEGIRQSALAIRGTMLTFSCRAFMNSTSTGLSLQQG